MTMSKFHPPVELLMEHAAGSACEAVDLLVACHTTYCVECRTRVAELEGLGARLSLGDAASQEGDAAALSDLLARLDSDASQVDVAAATPAVEDPLFPTPLLHYTGPSDQVAWKRVLPGVYLFELDLRWGDVPIRLTRARAGRGIPKHTHEGYECDLILQGGLHDLTRGGDFERGDVQAADETVTHELRALEGEDCILVAFNEGRPQGRSIGAKLLYRYLGW